MKKTGKKRPYRAGRRKTKGRKIPVISSTAFTSVPTCSVNRPSVNFDNLIQVPLSSQPQDRQGQLCVALFNACSVGTPEKRTEIADFIIDLCVDVLFLTETWLRQAGDEAKCADLAPPGFTAKSFPRSSRGGGLAIVLKDSLLPHFSWTTSLPFCHTSFELIHATLTLTQKTLHFYTLYRPPPNRKNKLTDSLFFEQFPDLLEHCNSLAGNSFILGDFNFH
ncbi:endonuclease/exonuclease/phosphatase family protein, partial [Thiolapillus sp.]